MDFLELIAASAIGATVPIILSRYLDRRQKRREEEALRKTGLGRFIEWYADEADKTAGMMADTLTSRQDERERG